MLDLKLIREKPDEVKAQIARLHTTAPIDEILELDERRRALLTQVEALKAQRNEGSKAVSRIKDPAERQALIERLRDLGDEITALDDQVKVIDAELRDLLLRVPNLPLPDVPDGPDESANVVRKYVGEPPSFSFPPKPHWEIGEQLGIIDFERGRASMFCAGTARASSGR